MLRTLCDSVAVSDTKTDTYFVRTDNTVISFLKQKKTMLSKVTGESLLTVALHYATSILAIKFNLSR